MIESYTGIPTDYVVIGLAGVCLLLLLFLIILAARLSGLRRRYMKFMSGKNGKSLEETLIYRLDQIDGLIEANNDNERGIDSMHTRMKLAFNKYGLVKYDALQEMGGKLSYALAMLDERNNGFVINNVHSREGCYNYIKEIIDGNSIASLSDEESEALQAALSGKNR